MKPYNVVITRNDRSGEEIIRIFAAARNDAIAFIRRHYRRRLVRVIGARRERVTLEGNDALG